MRRRSFLAGLFAAPVLAPAIAKAAAAQASESKVQVNNISGELVPEVRAALSGRVSSSDGCFVIDFEQNRVVISGPYFADGSVTARPIDARSLSAISANLGTITTGTLNGQ